MAMRFEDLEVWKRAARLGADLYKATAKLRDWGYRDQLTRAGLSISSNIAEGFERSSNLDCIRFLDYAKGSTAEVRSQLYIGIDIGYVEPEKGQQWIDECKTIAGMLAALMRRRREFVESTREDEAPYSLYPPGPLSS